MNDKKRFDKFAFFLPNIFTALNVACGYTAIMYSIVGQYYVACMIIMLGALFDSVDGRVARMTGTQSSFGEQFDSLSDLISFGMAPAIMYYNKFLIGYGRIGIVVSFIFLLSGALRLARFNANIKKVNSDYFQGLPIPGAAAAIIGFILVSIDFPEYFNHAYIFIPYIIFYSVLMISNFPFPSFKQSPWVRKHKKQVLLLIFLVITSLFIYEKIMIPLLISLYVLSSIIYALFHKRQLEGVFDWDDELEENE